MKYLLRWPEAECIFEERQQVDEVQCYVDANWGGEPDSRSVSGGALFARGALVSSWSRTQGSTALSSAESELYALVTGATAAEHAAHILEELQGGRIKRAILTAAVEKAGVGK